MPSLGGKLVLSCSSYVRAKKQEGQPKVGMEIQRESIAQLDLLHVARATCFLCIRLVLYQQQPASFFYSSTMGKIGSRSITIFLLCLCLNQLPILRSEYFSFSYVLKIKCNMHQSLESGSSCSVKRRSTCLLTTINFNLQSGFNGIGCQGSVRHPKGVQSHVDSTFGISNFWC